MNIIPIDILLAEDSEDDVVLIRETLEGTKLVNLAQVVPDGEQALDYLRQAGQYRNAQRPGLVLLDINMPRKNGLEVLEAMKADPKLRMLPVIMLTISGREEDVVRAYANGACSYIRKPVGFNDFQKLVNQFCLYWAQVATIPGHPAPEPNTKEQA